MNTIFVQSTQSATPRRLPWVETTVAMVILLVAWLYGFVNTRSPIKPLVSNVLPGTQQVEADGEIFTAYDGNGQVLGFAAAADATGYGGPICLLVGIDPQGEIVGIQVIEQRETPGFYTLLRANGFIEGFIGLSAAQPFVLGEDVDAVSGATLSASAVAQAVYTASQAIQTGVIEPVAPAIRFGIPEITLLGMFTGVLVLPRLRQPRQKKFLRWTMLIVSMVILGFVLNQPLTLANFASLLAGYWPSWQDHLYWYLMLGGVIVLTISTGKNLYCAAICPFLTVQEIFGHLGTAKPFLPRQVYRQLSWVPRWLAVLALAMGLAFRQPGAASFEPFGTLFSFSAGFFPWMLLVFVLCASFFIWRPFCHYLCPVGAVLNFIIFIRKQVVSLWKITLNPRKN